MKDNTGERVRSRLPSSQKAERFSDTILTPRKKPSFNDIDIMLNLYSEQVGRSNLSTASQAIYIDFASLFVRWMKGEFQPGLFAVDDSKAKGGGFAPKGAKTVDPVKAESEEA